MRFAADEADVIFVAEVKFGVLNFIWTNLFPSLVITSVCVPKEFSLTTPKLEEDNSVELKVSKFKS